MIKNKKNLGLMLLFILITFVFLVFPVSADFNASSDQSDVNWRVYATTPINLTYTKGCFWVNWTWEAGTGRIPPSSWNVSINSVPHNGITNTYYNQSTTANGWVNISVLGWNSTDGVLSESSVEGQQQACHPFYISGYIKDIDSVPIQNAFVWDDYSFDSNYTNSSGYYILGSRNGTYEITASKADFHDNSITVTVAGANLTNQNITLAPILATPTIIDWFNNATNNTNTSFSVNVSQSVYFNATADQSVTWHWFVEDTEMPFYNYDNISLSWNISKIVNVSVYGNNANGNTQIVTWMVYVGQPVKTIENLIYEQNQLLLEENEMIGQTMLFVIFLIIAFVFLAAGYLSPNATLKIFGAAFSSLLFIILAYAIIGNQFGEKLQMAWLATLLGALGIIQAIYTLLIVISLLYMMFTSRRQAGVDSIPFDPGDRNW